MMEISNKQSIHGLNNDDIQLGQKESKNGPALFKYKGLENVNSEPIAEQKDIEKNIVQESLDDQIKSYTIKDNTVDSLLYHNPEDIAKTKDLLKQLNQLIKNNQENPNNKKISVGSLEKKVVDLIARLNLGSKIDSNTSFALKNLEEACKYHNQTVAKLSTSWFAKQKNIFTKVDEHAYGTLNQNMKFAVKILGNQIALIEKIDNSYQEINKPTTKHQKQYNKLLSQLQLLKKVDYSEHEEFINSQYSIITSQLDTVKKELGGLVSSMHVKQGKTGDCYLLAYLIGYFNVEISESRLNTQDLITYNEDGSVTLSFPDSILNINENKYKGLAEHLQASDDDIVSQSPLKIMVKLEKFTLITEDKNIAKVTTTTYNKEYSQDLPNYINCYEYIFGSLLRFLSSEQQKLNHNSQIIHNERKIGGYDILANLAGCEYQEIWYSENKTRFLDTIKTIKNDKKIVYNIGMDYGQIVDNIKHGRHAWALSSYDPSTEKFTLINPHGQEEIYSLADVIARNPELDLYCRYELVISDLLADAEEIIDKLTTTNHKYQEVLENNAVESIVGNVNNKAMIFEDDEDFDELFKLKSEYNHAYTNMIFTISDLKTKLSNYKQYSIFQIEGFLDDLTKLEILLQDKKAEIEIAMQK